MTILAAASATEQALCAANAPVISFDENGTPGTMTETGQILNTGGYDFINGSADGLTGTPSGRKPIAEGPEFLSPLPYFC
jgi:hypothetical protein